MTRKHRSTTSRFVQSVVFFTVLTCLSGSVVADNKPLKVFVLAGQSNMQGHAQIRTIEHVGMDPKTTPLLRQMQDDDGTPKICDKVWISYLSSGGEKRGRLTAGFGADENKIGPEFTFGIVMEEILKEPILIIKTAWGGKSINTDFRPPSAGPYEFNSSQIEQFEKQGKDLNTIKGEKAKATGHYYRLMIDQVKKVLGEIESVYPDYDPDQGYELAGFVWFQGWNDMVDRGTYPNREQPGGYDDYSKVMAHFIRDVRKELDAPGMPFVIGVLGVNGPVDKYSSDQQRYRGVHQNFRDAMAAPAAMPEFQGSVVAVLTENYWDMELTGLRSREAEISQKVRKLQSEKKLSRQEVNSETEKYRAEEFSDRELEILEKGVSNAEYHYLGSAKIMAQIGKGFAEAMADLMSGSNH